MIGIAPKDVIGVEPADHRLDCVDRDTGPPEVPNEPGDDKGLADVGPGGRDEVGGHALSAA